MSLTDSTAQSSFRLKDNDQMRMIRPKAICPNRNAATATPLGHELDASPVILITKEGPLSTISSLCHVVWYSRATTRGNLAMISDYHEISSESRIMYGVPGTRGTRRSGYRNAVKRSGIPHVRFHDLCHTFASHLVMGGVHIRTVQELLGHKDIRMTMRYSHFGPDHMRKAVSVLDYESEQEDALEEAHS